MHRLKLLFFTFGIILSGLAYAEDEEVAESATKAGMVIVEPVNVIISETEDDFGLSPYRERRPKWGLTTSLGYSTYEPLKYEPNFVAAAFSDVYSSPSIPMLDLLFNIKRNMAIGSLGIEFGAGYYEVASSNVDFGDSKLNLIPARLGVVFSLDTLGADPLLIPYVAGGVYTMIFNETLGGNSHDGNTQASAYFHGGVAISLQWIDRYGAITAYRESGVEMTTAFFEAQMYLPGGAEADGDFSNDISYAGGLRLEF